jgi:hypothetical protein
LKVSLHPFQVSLRADDGDVNSHQFCEIPVAGPGRANRLVVITGLAICGTKDIGGLDVVQDDIVSADVFITTDYHLDKRDNWLGIVDGQDMSLLAATYVSLACIASDNEDAPGTPDGCLMAINDVKTRINEEDARSVLIHLKVGLQGDSTLGQISYQANILIQKALM